MAESADVQKPVESTNVESTNSVEIKIHPLTEDPTKAWEQMSVNQTVEKVEPLPLDTPVYEDKVRFVCISDTHAKVEFDHKIPPGDVLLHGGDFTKSGEYSSICKLNVFMRNQPHKYKFVIAGNHDITMEPPPGGLYGRLRDLNLFWGVNTDIFFDFMRSNNIEHPRELLYSCQYLEDKEETAFGLRIYGSPWQPTFHDWGFNLDRGEEILEKAWKKIPEGIDVLLTHGPPIGHGDLCSGGHRAGCVELLNTIQQRVKPKYHVFGHIHEGHGVTTDGYTTYVNASIMTYYYRPKNPPIIFDIPLPPGVKKEDFPPQKLPPKVKSKLEVWQEEKRKEDEEKAKAKGQGQGQGQTQAQAQAQRHKHYGGEFKQQYMGSEKFRDRDRCSPS